MYDPGGGLLHKPGLDPAGKEQEAHRQLHQPSSQQYPAGATTILTNHRLNNIQQEQRLKQSSSEQYIEWATTTLNNHRLNNIQCKNDDLKQLSSPTVNKTK